MQVICHQEEFVLGSSLPKEFYSEDTSKEECGRRTDEHGGKPHNLIHSDERTSKCELCSKEFLQIGWLLHHKGTHSVANPYICHLFASKVSLKVRIRTHTGEKPSKCSICSKIFTTCWALSRHTQVHLQEQPEDDDYRCEVCSKSFTTRSALYGHTHIHSIWCI
jgi:KRAB domain-containing zinc finger protein